MLSLKIDMHSGYISICVNNNNTYAHFKIILLNECEVSTAFMNLHVASYKNES